MITVVERTVAYTGQPLQLHVIQLFAVAECSILSSLERGRQYDSLQSRLIVDVVAKRSDTFGNDSTANVVAAEESVWLDGLKRGGELNGAQAPVLVEAAAANSFQLRGQCQPRQVGVMRKGIVGQFGHGHFREVEVNQLRQLLAQDGEVFIVQRPADAQALHVGKVLRLL